MGYTEIPELLNCVNKEPINVIEFATEAKRLFDIDFTLTNKKRMYDAEVQEVDDHVKLFDTNYIGYIEGLRLSREKERDSNSQNKQITHIKNGIK